LFLLVFPLSGAGLPWADSRRRNGLLRALTPEQSPQLYALLGEFSLANSPKRILLGGQEAREDRGSGRMRLCHRRFQAVSLTRIRLPGNLSLRRDTLRCYLFLGGYRTVRLRSTTASQCTAGMVSTRTQERAGSGWTQINKSVW
jgi:hypothetical protein